MNVKEKIKKLLSLATSPNENEAKAALLKAKELMAKNKLNEEDFKDEKKQDLVHLTCENIKWTTDSGNVWMATLCRIISEEHMCIAAWSTIRGRRTHTLVITGLKEDAEICKDVIEYAVGFVMGQVKILTRKSVSGDAKSIRASYGEGFALGLKMAYEDQKEEHPEWGLVVVKSDEVKSYEDNLGTKSVKTKKNRFDPLAFAQGQIDGQEFKSKKAIAV